MTDPGGVRVRMTATVDGMAIGDTCRVLQMRLWDDVITQGMHEIAEALEASSGVDWGRVHDGFGAVTVWCDGFTLSYSPIAGSERTWVLKGLQHKDGGSGDDMWARFFEQHPKTAGTVRL